MGDMVEKVTAVIYEGMERQLARTRAEEIARAALEACHHEELVALVKPLAAHADYMEQHFELDEYPDAVDPETHLVMPGLSLADCQRARAVLAKVEASDA